MTLPTFLIIGAPKCGSSALYDYLQGRDDVVMSATKEPGYFGARYDRGIEWYREQFVGAADHVGEASVGYLADPEAPARIAAVLPEAKLVVLARNPFDRARSHYWWRRNQGTEQRSLDEVLADGAQAFPVSDGLYHRNICRTLEHFPADALLVLTTEDLRSGEALARLDAHLGLARRAGEVIPSSNEATTARSGAVASALRGMDKLRSARHKVPEPVRRAGARVIGRARGMNQRSFQAPPLTAEQVERLGEHLHPDLDRLEAFLGRDLAGWRAPADPA
jgi:hypothetical protein